MPVRIFLVIFCATVARFLLVLNLPIRFLPNNVHDDGLFMRLATNLASGVWLGDLNQFTFMKGSGYPAFLAVTSVSGLPLSAAHALFQAAAISAASWAVFRLTRSQWGALATFLALSFCPVGLALHRVVPDQIYWAQTLLVFSLFTIIVFAPPRDRAAAMIVAGLTGLIFGWTLLTGEEGVWFLPALGFLTIGAVLLTLHNRDDLRALGRNVCVVTAGFVAANIAVLTENLHVYGSLGSGNVEQQFLSPIIKPKWISVPRTLVAAVEAILHPDLATATPLCSVSVENDDFNRYWTFLNKPRVKTVQANREVGMVGWYYDSQSIAWPAFKAYNQEGQEIPSIAARQVSPDLQRHFSDDRAGDNRFLVMFRSPDACAITAQAPDGLDLRVVIDPQQGLYDAAGSAQINIDAVRDSAGGVVNSSEKLAGSVSFNLIGLYEGLVPFLLPVGLIATVAASWRAFSARAFPAMLLMALAAWILAASRIVLLALINTSAFPSVTIHYSAPANYLAIVAACLSLTALSVGPRPE
jgi:hypothetical protein